MTTLSRRYRFSSSHRLHAPQLTDQQNREIYGKCNNPWGHGHDYVLEVTVTGPVQERTGRIVNVAALDGYVRERVLDAFDHRDMNRDIPEFEGRSPTAENIALVIRELLEKGWSQAFGAACLGRIRIEETKRNFVELR